MKAYELYSEMSPALVLEQFMWMREEERELYKTAIATLAEPKKLRPAFIQKKPVPDQINWLHTQLKSKRTNAVAEHLLQGWFMQGHSELLITFCDAMGIEHDGKGAVNEELPEELDTEKLKGAADALFEKYPDKLVSLYLYVFNIQTTDGWEALTELIANDSRIAIK